jgi:hypothetical protein
VSGIDRVKRVNASLAAALGGALLLTGLTAPAVSASQACTGSPSLGITFICTTPGVSNIPVPIGATSVDVVVIGGGGGGGSRGGRGGHGAHVSARLAISGIQELLITVASGGQGSVEDSSTNPGVGVGGSSGGGTAGTFGSYGAAADSTPLSVMGRWDRWPTGGGLSAIADGSGKSAGSLMNVGDLLVIAGGGGGAALTFARNGGDGASGIDGAGGDGAPADTTNEKSAKGGALGVGGAGGIGFVQNGQAGAHFSGGAWGAGGAGAGGNHSSGGAGYGGGGGAMSASSFSAAAGGSFARSTSLIGNAMFRPATNGGAAADRNPGGDGGNGSVSLTFYAPPTVTTTPATAITTSTAEISGVVNAHGAATSALTITYSTDEATVNAGNGTTATVSPAVATGTSDTHVSASLTGLTPNTQYFYRISATNSDGTSTGATLSFRTGSLEPTPAPPGPGPAPSTGNGSSAPPTSPNTSPTNASSITPSTPQPSAALPPANAAQPRVITSGIVLLDADTARRTMPQVMMKAPADRIGRSPIVRSRVDRPLKLVVQKGLEANSQYVTKIKRRGQDYNELGVVQTNADGAVQLPVFAVRNSGQFVIAMAQNQHTRYIKVHTRR